MINSLDIYRSGAVIATIDIDEQTVFNEKLQGAKLINCAIKNPVAVSIQTEDYIIYKGERFTCNIVPDFTKDSETLVKDYSIIFEAEFYHLLDWYVEHLGEKDFTSYYGTAKDHLNMVIASANLKSSGWIVGEVDDTEEKSIPYSWTYVRTALDDIATAFGLEYQFTGKTIRMVKSLGRNTGLSFQMGRGKGLHQIKRSTDTSKASVNRVYGVGGTKNIDASYRDGTQKSLIFDGEYVQTPEVTAWLNGTGAEVRIKEGKFVNEDIFPKFKGTVSATTILKDAAGRIVSATITDPAIDFDVNLQAIPNQETPIKVSVLSGALTGLDFEVSAFDAGTRTLTLIPNTDSAGYVTPNDSSNIVAGDKFTFIDIMMPGQYVTNAQLELKAATQTYLDDNKFDRLIYGVVPDEKIMRDNLISLAVGDLATVVDAEMEVDEILRFVEISYPLVNDYAVTAVIGNQVIYDRVVKLFADVQAVHQEIQAVDRRSEELAKRGVQELRLLEGSIFDTDGKFDTDKMNIGVLTIALGVVGSKSQDFRLSSVFITDNYNGDPNAVSITSGELIHREIANTGDQNVWQLQPIVQSGLTPASLYYVYCKCSTSAQVGSYVITTDQVLYDAVPGFYMFLAGVIYPVISGYRNSDFSNGIADINGNRLKIGKVVSRDGLTGFDLDNSTIFGKIQFRNTAGTLTDVNTVSDTAQLAIAKNYASGKMLYTDPEFSGSYGASGYNGITFYNNAGGSDLTVTRGTSYSDFINGGYPANPNSSGCYLQISYNGGGNVSPGFGGFYFANQARANAVFITRIVAMIPVGRNIQWASNQIGTGANGGQWLTSQAGTGKWEEYLCKVECGSTGTFSSTNFFYISDGGNVGFAWYVSYATVYDMTAANADPLKYADIQAQASVVQANSYADSVAISKANIAQANAIAQSSTAAQNYSTTAYNNAVAASNAYASTVANSASSAAQIAAAADASNKATSAFNQAEANRIAQYNALTTALKPIAYQEFVDFSQLGNTIIQNGRIISTLIEAQGVWTNILNAGIVNTQELRSTSGSIAGWTISSNSLYGTNGGVTIELNATNNDPSISISNVNGEQTLINKNGLRTSAFVANDVIVDRALFINADHVFMKTGTGSNGENIYGGRVGDYGSNGFALIERNGNLTTVNAYDITAAHFITGNNVRYNTLTNLSDIRFKKAVKPLKYGLKQIMALAPISYKYNLPKEDQIRADNITHLGLSAQAVKEVMPELVMDGDRLSVSMIELVPVLINAIKELQQQIDKLK